MLQAPVFIYRFRMVLAGVFAVAFLLTISALVTSLGSHTVLDGRTHTASSVSEPSILDSDNVIATGASRLVESTHRALISVGTGLYKTCRAITSVAADSGRAVVHGTAVGLHDVWTATTWTGRGVGKVVLFPLRIAGKSMLFALRAPGKVVGSVTNTAAVSAIVRPSDNDQLPIISAQTSAAILANYNAQQQKEIAKLQAAQLVANEDLGGAVVAGDPNHGGYPTAWDAPASQDSRLDTWGMYNRECVSYAAWKVYQTYGSMPYWGGVGNANQWVGDAQAAGIATGSAPRVHSVAISMRGYYGHAMWVEAVKGDMIYVSQYNYDLQGHYSEMWINGSAFTYIYFK